MASPTAQRIAANIRAELARQDISQGQLARHLFGSTDHTTRNLVWRRLAGRVSFRVDELIAIAEFLHVDVETLVSQDAA